MPQRRPHLRQSYPTSSPIREDGTVDERRIPSAQSVFFDNWPHSATLPSPADVREAAQGPNLLSKRHSYRAQVLVQFPELQLVVKYGPAEWTPIAEGQNLFLLSFVPRMRVPQVYGWCEDGDERFIYMERIDGVTLDERWHSLSAPQKLDVAHQLRAMLSSMKSLRQEPTISGHIGALHCGHVYEQIWGNRSSSTGPFDSVKAFTDAFFSLACLPADNPYVASLRRTFSDDASIVFTHTDLAMTNILMSATTAEVLAIIDWRESGWYPDFWDYVKAFSTVFTKDGDWRDHIKMFLQPAHDDEQWSYEELMGTGMYL